MGIPSRKSTSSASSMGSNHSRVRNPPVHNDEVEDQEQEEQTLVPDGQEVVQEEQTLVEDDETLVDLQVDAREEDDEDKDGDVHDDDEGGEKEAEEESDTAVQARQTRGDNSGEGGGGGGRFNKYLESLKDESEPSSQLVALTQLCEDLSFCEEGSVSSSSSKSVSPILVALANTEMNPDIMLLAIRAIAYLCDASPKAPRFLVKEDVVPALCARLLAVEYLDVAEQCIQALEKISQRFPADCLKGGVIMAVLGLIDFFSLSVQRVAVSVVANICVYCPLDCSSELMPAVPILSNLLGCEDQKLVETVAICLKRIVDRVYHSSEMVDELCKHNLVHHLAHVIASNSGNSLSPRIYAVLVGLLSKLVIVSVGVVKILFELNISSTLKSVLSSYDHSHANPYSNVGGGVHLNKIDGVLRFLNLLLPPLSVNTGDNLAVTERVKLVLDQPELLQQFGMDILPVLVQVVNSGVNLNVCYGALSVINKILYFSRSDMLPDLLEETNISSFLAGMFTRKDNHVLVLALSIVKTLLQGLPDTFLNSFMKEGVFNAIDTILTPEKCSETKLTTSSSTIEEGTANSVGRCFCHAYDINQSPSSGAKTCKLEKSSVHILAEQIRTTYLTAESRDSGLGLTEVLQKLRKLCADLYAMVDVSMKNNNCDECEQKLLGILRQIMAELTGGESLSTFEFIESGIVKSLLYYLSNGQYQNGKMDPCKLPNNFHVLLKRFEMFARFSLSSSTQQWQDTPLAILLRILHSAVSSLENFPVVVNQAIRLRETYTTFPTEGYTENPCLQVRFIKDEGETELRDYDDVATVDAFTSLDAIESFLWPQISSNIKNGQDVIHDLDGQSQKLGLYLDGKLLDQKLTLYQAILQLRVKAENELILGPLFWKEEYKITYRKATKLQQSNPQDFLPETDFSTVSDYQRSLWQNLFCSLTVGLPRNLNSSTIYETLFLLKILEVLNKYPLHLMPHSLNSVSEERNGGVVNVETLCRVPQTEFVSTKLIEKLKQQMQDPLASSYGKMPLWYEQLITTFPFLFDFGVKCKYFKLALLGSSQAQSHALIDEQSHESSTARKKFTVSRNCILDSATEMMNQHADSKGVLEVEYSEEVGTGLGPTMEFYTLVSREFQKVSLAMWRDDHGLLASEKKLEADDSQYVMSSMGLFPRPWSAGSSDSDGTVFSDMIKKFILLGQVVARTINDGRVLDLPLSRPFYRLILEQELNINDIQSLDPGLGKALLEFQTLIDRQKNLDSMPGKNTPFLSGSYFKDTNVEDLCLDFSLPGYPDYTLTSAHNQQMVNMINLEEYVSFIVDATVRSGISRQVEAFKSGFNQVFPIKSLQIFTEDELELLLCGQQDAWTANDLLDHIKFDHGYTAKSPAVNNFLEILQEFESEQKQAFVQFVTGTRRLPPGGLAFLKPKMTVVRKHCIEWADGELPSVMTCANYLKLPAYSSKEIMRERLLYAITEGQGSFHLS